MMTVSPAPTPVFVSVDKSNTPAVVAAGWSVQDPNTGSDQNTVTGA